MATVFRIEKQKNYTVMSNHHLKNPALSLKAKGLLSQMLSLPDNWDYSLKGLAKINKESIDAIRTAVWELEKAGYIVRTQGHGERGKFASVEYIIYETPQINSEEPAAEPPAKAADEKLTDPSESSKSVDTQGLSPWLENPTPVKNQENSQSNISPKLDFPTSDNPTSDNPTSEQLNIKYNKYINRLNTQSINQESQKDLTISADEDANEQSSQPQALAANESTATAFTQLLADCDLDCLPEGAQPLMRAALEEMFYAPYLKIRGQKVYRPQILERLSLLNGDILQAIYYAYLSSDKVDKPIKNRTSYLISMLYNNVVQELAEADALTQDVSSTVLLIERGFLEPQDYLQNSNALIRSAAARKLELQNSG
jgi:hypothetical protein